MANGFQGQEGAEVPEMTPEIVGSISDRYIELYENITGEKFDKGSTDGDRMEQMQANIANMIARLR
jgi:phosphoribosylaminoimidazole-succinocarboxamide synthase